MIIQCDECKTKFKLDDSKVKPEGVKVKCKKCNHVFFVFPEKEEIERGEEILSETTQQLGLMDSSLNVQQDTEKLEKELFSDKPTFEEDKEELQQEFNWEKFTNELNYGETQSSLESSTFGEINIEMDKEKVFEESYEEQQKKDDTLLEGKEDILETSTPDFDFLVQDGGEPKKEFDFQEEDKTKEEFTIQSQEQDLFFEKVNEFEFNEEQESLTEKKEDFEIDINDKKFIEDKNVKTDSKTEVDEIINKDFEQANISNENISPHVEDFVAPTTKRFNILSILISILIVVVIGGGGTGYMWWKRLKMVENMGSIGITNVKTKYGEAKDPAQIFIVTGKIKNEFNVPKSFLKIKCTVYGKNNVKLAEKVVFAGNIFTDAELKELTYTEIEKGLNNKMGKSMVNVDVPPGKLIDFMLVFDKLPQDAEFIEVEGV